MKEENQKETVSLECPTLKKKCEVDFEVNVFRGANRGGLQVTDCSEFLHENNAETCGQECIHTIEANQLHEQKIQKHRDDLGTIGPNVIG